MPCLPVPKSKYPAKPKEYVPPPPPPVLEKVQIRKIDAIVAEVRGAGASIPLRKIVGE